MPCQARDFAQSRALRLILCNAHVLAFKPLAEHFQDSTCNVADLGVLADGQSYEQQGLKGLALTLVSIDWNTVSSHAKRSITFVLSAEVTAAPTERITKGEV